MNLSGIALGLFSFGVIGFGFFWVIRGEYYLGYLWWPYPLLLGLALIAGSLFAPNAGVSALLGIAGASFVWGATELKEQAVRANLGWFRQNPRQKPAPPLVDLIKRIGAPHL
ncbi:DUF4491 family protein [Chloroflexales bacterium ZM16-3]|nr:DUF4491 family protein [Chloroflexales bacterium ZM16-3]